MQHARVIGVHFTQTHKLTHPSGAASSAPYRGRLQHFLTSPLTTCTTTCLFLCVFCKAVPIYIHFQYGTDISAFDISQYRYQSNINKLRMMHGFITYFILWNFRKASQRIIVNNSIMGFVVYTCCVGV